MLQEIITLQSVTTEVRKRLKEWGRWISLGRENRVNSYGQTDGYCGGGGGLEWEEETKRRRRERTSEGIPGAAVKIKGHLRSHMET